MKWYLGNYGSPKLLSDLEISEGFAVTSLVLGVFFPLGGFNFLPQGLVVSDLFLFWKRVSIQIQQTKKDFRKCLPISNKRYLSSSDTAKDDTLRTQESRSESL